MSRTKNSIRNSQVALIFYFIEIIIGFWSRKVFIDYLGTEILGLNTTAMNLLNFLNIAELGIVSAVTFTLYKPISQNDQKSINEIISVQGWLYRKIGFFVGGGALVLMLFFPFIFNKVEVPMWYVYASFLAFLYSSLLTYFFNYKQIILSASQQEYKITLNYKSLHIIKSLIQIYAVSHFSNPYEWWLILQFLLSTVATINLNRTIRKSFPKLQVSIKAGKLLRKNYEIIITKVKQLFFHKIAGFVLSQTSTLIIYAFTSLTMVAIYGNYMLIINSVNAMFNTAFNGINASIGHLVAENNKKKTLSVLGELFTTRFLCASISTFCIYILITPFISIWIGKEYIMDNNILIVILVYMFIMLMRGVIDSFISAYGLFKDIYAPIIEAILNLSLSILLGYYWGIIGVISGVVISLICVIIIWKPYFLFKYGIKEGGWQYIKMYLTHIAIFAFSCFVTTHIIEFIFQLNNINTFIELTIYAIATLSIIAIIEISLLYLLTSSMKNITKRVFLLINQKNKKK